MQGEKIEKGNCEHEGGSLVRMKSDLSNAASNLEHMSFSDISVTQMDVSGESASGLKSLDMIEECGIKI